VFAAPFRDVLNRLLGRAGKTAAADSADTAIAQGCQLAERGDAAAAARAFQHALALAPAHAEAHFRLGLAWRDLQRLDAAAACYRRAIGLRPDYVEAHNNLGSVLQMQGQLPEALASYRQAVALQPAFGQPYLNLGRLCVALGDTANAAAAFQTAIDRGIDVDSFRHLSNALAGATTAAAPAGYTRTLFDGFADDFDRRLVDELGYRLPAVLAARIKALQPGNNLRVLDLGCGTGLCGSHLAGSCSSLTGIDLSPAMLAKARARQLYDVLVEQDIAGWLRTAPAAAFDVVIAADVLIYIGELNEIFGAVARALAPGGLFLFSIELVAGEDFRLQTSGRYAHAPDYIRRLAATTGLGEVESFAQHIRGDVSGSVFILRKT
jgi:predicted TPR repeat methyltransferase